MSATRVLVVDDHPVVVEGIERFAAVEPRLEVIGTAGTIEQAEARLADATPHVLSLDVQLPGMRGPRTVEALARHEVPILLFTLHPIDEAVAALVRAGARGYLAKASPMDAYLEAVEALRTGERRLPEALEALLAADEARGPEELLTPRELEVFRLLARGLSTKEVAFELGRSASTVYTHAERIRKKLGVDTAAELVRYAERWRFDRG
ncbi:MAG TPA: response regulator transcription factor [Polyangiaceae bacterium LLY-WYZ-15_(1-7)]|nr:DNA-binding response regulator [Myxococcales bacterium]MAT26894.1 DNA-binding response regulator [Sandaracinus sp.]HJK91199.1 response regulator transcription factor [Polyangiaceae bacterium LLY-WYZ-15_(1-7)]MBJ70223.1 DNA-binding response regulator [Sandaracinus sp.]HJL03097.1 response regulator transcription factor [Polyangiaceae bacterium LLY-WYZ-15_(1-7)]